MTISASTGFRNARLLTGSFKTIMGSGAGGTKIAIYAGARRADADDAANATLLLTFTKDAGATGFDWETAVTSAGVLDKLAADAIEGTGVAAGQATWYCCYPSGGDPTSASTSAIRFDGSVAVSNADLNMSNLTAAVGSPHVLTAFSFVEPQN